MSIYGIWKNVIDGPICRAGIETHTECTRGHMGEGEGGMNWEIKMDVYT